MTKLYLFSRLETIFKLAYGKDDAMEMSTHQTASIGSTSDLRLDEVQSKHVRTNLLVCLAETAGVRILSLLAHAERTKIVKMRQAHIHLVILDIVFQEALLDQAQVSTNGKAPHVISG